MLESSALPAEIDPFLFAGERWFIDETAGDVVRVLAAAALDPRPFTELAHLTGHSPRAKSAIERARTLVLEMESSDSAAAWSTEIDHVLPADPLNRLLQRRRAALGFPPGRPMREGDVYWVGVVSENESDYARLSDPAVDRWLRSARTSRVEPVAVWAVALSHYRPEWIWDVTAAARQAGKWRVDRALRTSAENQAHG